MSRKKNNGQAPQNDSVVMSLEKIREAKNILIIAAKNPNNTLCGIPLDQLSHLTRELSKLTNKHKRVSDFTTILVKKNIWIRIKGII